MCQLRRFGGVCQRFWISVLLIQSQSQAQYDYGIRLSRVGVNGFAQVGLRGLEVVFLELQCPDNRIRVGPQQALVCVDFVLRRPRRNTNIRVDSLGGVLGHLHGFVQALILVKVGIARALGEYAGYDDQRFRIIRVNGQHFAPEFKRLVRIVRALIGAHGSLEQDDPHFAVRELGCEVIRGLLQRCGISVGGRSFVRIELSLRLGLWRTLSLRFCLRRCSRLRGTLLRSARLCCGRVLGR